jgi:elongation factor Ts
MSNISLDEVKRLKELTGVGLTDAKAALVEAEGNFDQALEAMRKKGLTRAEKKGEREARQGLVDSYVHGGRIGVVVEINCETDFVARTEDFKSLVHDIAMHIAASAPQYVALDEVPAEIREAKQAEFSEKVTGEGKPENMIPQIVEGMLKKYFAEQTLLEQPFIKNPDQTIDQLVKEHIARLGENIVVRQFRRIELGVSE